MKFLSQVKAEEVFFVNMESYFSVIAGNKHCFSFCTFALWISGSESKIATSSTNFLNIRV